MVHFQLGIRVRDVEAGDPHRRRLKVVEASFGDAGRHLGTEAARLAGFMRHQSDLWRTYEALRDAEEGFAMRQVRKRGDIYPVFRELFARQSGTEGEAR